MLNIPFFLNNEESSRSLLTGISERKNISLKQRAFWEYGINGFVLNKVLYIYQEVLKSCILEFVPQ